MQLYHYLQQLCIKVTNKVENIIMTIKQSIDNCHLVHLIPNKLVNETNMRYSHSVDSVQVKKNRSDQKPQKNHQY